MKRISKALAKSLPVDYYTVFSELGEALINELDFLSEASAMRKISYAVSHCNDGTPADPPVTIPLPIGELVSKRVLVMDFVSGTPLNRLQETMKERGIEPGSPEAKIAGRRILNSLSSAFGEQIDSTQKQHLLSFIYSLCATHIYSSPTPNKCLQSSTNSGRMIFGAGFIHGVSFLLAYSI